MLDFWYSARCTREIKWGICIVVALCIYLASNIQALTTLYSIVAIVFGLAIHVVRQQLLPYFQSKPYMKFGFHFSILIALMVMLSTLPQPHRLILSIQVIGFVALGLFLISNHVQRAPRI